MFPDWQEETLKNLLELHGSADAVALHISTTSTNTEMPQETCHDGYNDISVGDHDEEDETHLCCSNTSFTTQWFKDESQQ